MWCWCVHCEDQKAEWGFIDDDSLLGGKFLLTKVDVQVKGDLVNWSSCRCGWVASLETSLGQLALEGQQEVPDCEQLANLHA